MLIPRAKTEIPRVSENGLPRTRLLAAMGAPATVSPVIEVCAPAGYGKSTLLAQYARSLREQAVPVGWVTCDRHDADLPRWWTAVLTALSTGLGAGEPQTSAGHALDALEPPHTPEPAFLAEFVEAVGAIDTVVTLVLDDLHELPDGAVVATLADLVRNLPPRLHLVLGTRRDPAIPLHRLKLEGRLQEIRARELRFDPAEMRQVLAGDGVHLTDELLTALWQRTEGWPAATRLATIALADQDDPVRFVEHFAGDDRGVADYLVAEILDRQPDDIVRFLLDTCVAEELTSELAARLSGRADAGAVLERLEHANALVQRLGRGGEWYRFHALLRSYLLAELRRRDLAAARAQHRDAAQWFADHDEGAPALEHAVAASDDAMVRELLADHGLRLLLVGGGQRLRGVLAGCSEAVLADPDVLLLVAVVALSDGDLHAGDRAIARAEATGPLAGPAAALHRLARLSRARLHGAPDGLDGTDDLDDRAGTPPERCDGSAVELLTLANRAGVRIAAGDYPGAQDDLEAALALSRQEGLDHLTLDCLNQLGGAAVGRSEVHDAGEWAAQAITFARERGWASSPRLAYAHLLSAWRAHLALDPDEATTQAAVAMALVQAGRVEPEVEIATRSGEAIMAFDRLPQRTEALRRYERVWETLAREARPSPALIGFANLAGIRLSLDLGEADRATAIVRRVEQALPDHGDAAVLRALTVLDARPGRAAALVAPVLTGALPTTVITVRMTAWLVDALAAERAGRSEAAHRALCTALDDGARTRILRPFYDLGRPAHEMLVATVGRAGHRETFLGELLAAWTAAAEKRRRSGSTSPTSSATAGAAELVAPLTRREIELLRDLPSLLTTEGIAEAHTLSVNTVKSHLRSLYRKLGAGSRREAVHTARRLSLL